MKAAVRAIFALLAVLIGFVVYAAPLQLDIYTKPSKPSGDKDSKIVSRVSIAQLQYLIPYFSLKNPSANQRDWVKVANPSDGAAGWINTRDYMDLMRQAEKDNIRTFEIKETVAPGETPQLVAYRDGQPVSPDQLKQSPTHSVFIQVVPQKDGHSKIVAYHDGKQLSDEEAQAWLHKLHIQQQKIIWQDMEMQEQMQRMFQRSSYQFNQMEGEDDGMPSAPTLPSSSTTPVLVYQQGSLSQPLSDVGHSTTMHGQLVDYPEFPSMALNH